LSWSCAALEPIYYTRRQKNEFGAMDPNVKLLIEEMAKQLRVEIKEGFAVHEASFIKRLDEVVVAEHLRDARLANLEEAAASSDKALTEWRPEVDASIASVKLELSKLNSFFTREAKASSGSKQGILTNGSAPANTSTADGPVGHRIDPSYRDCEFGRVFTQTHDSVKGTVYPSTPPSNFPVRLEFPHGVQSFSAPNLVGREARVPLGKLPKMNFPKFESENPKLWQSRCETYFEMYGVDPEVQVRVATMHFEGPAARWLQSINHRVRSASLKELCS
jgi:hypothetical protein